MRIQARRSSRAIDTNGTKHLLKGARVKAENRPNRGVRGRVREKTGRLNGAWLRALLAFSPGSRSPRYRVSITYPISDTIPIL